MSKLYKIIATFVVLCLAMVGLSSCNNTSFYDEWKDLGANVEKDHPFEYISIDKVETKIENDDTFVLLVITEKDSTAVSNISTLYEQYVYLSYDKKANGVIYVLDATSLFSDTSTRNTFTKRIKINKYYDVHEDYMVVACYAKGEVIVDTSSDSEETDRFLANKEGTSSPTTKVYYEAVAMYIFRDFPKLYLSK